MNKQGQWLYFCNNLQGYDCYRQGIMVPKYILFWTGYTSHDIIRHATDVTLRERPKPWK